MAPRCAVVGRICEKDILCGFTVSDFVTKRCDFKLKTETQDETILHLKVTIYRDVLVVQILLRDNDIK